MVTDETQNERERLDRKESYNTTNYPFFICHNGNWDVYADPQGRCASIPIAETDHPGGCHASHFGDINYVYNLWP